jgi:hypothetical protein
MNKNAIAEGGTISLLRAFARPGRAQRGKPPLGFDAGDTNLFRYVRNDPLGATDPAGLQRSDARITDPGTPVPSAKIGGAEVDVNGVKGKVIARTGVKYTKGNGDKVENGISIQYHGPNCGEFRIVQLLWREVRVFRGKDETLANVELDTTIGKYQSTTDINKPNYRVDSATKSVLYLSRGQGGIIRTPTRNLVFILDKPGDLALWVYNRYYKDDATVTKIISVGHYDWFLYHNKQAVYHVSWTSTATWEKGVESKDPVIEIVDGKPNEGPNKQQLDALKAHNPDYEESLTHIFNPNAKK